MGNLSTMISTIHTDFVRKYPDFNAASGRNIATLVSVMLDVKSSNMNELAAGLPKSFGNARNAYRYVERIFAHKNNIPSVLMAEYAKELLKQLSKNGETLILMLDQSHINAHCEVLMLCVRVKERALPLLWLVKECQGAIGFTEQEMLLKQLPALVPENAKVLFTADRFYGTASMIKWCQTQCFSYRIRLKGNLYIAVKGERMTVLEAFSRFPNGIERAELTQGGVISAFGFLHEEGHAEPWLIAMNDKPTTMKVQDYGLRWGIEAMFSDFKSRGFGLMESQIQKANRLSMLIFIMTIAMYYAVSNGIKTQIDEKKHE
jgi:Transposase DDE domain